MIQFFIITLCLLVLLFCVNGKIGRITTKVPNTTDEYLIDLPDERAYWDETNEAIIKLKMELDTNGIRDEDLEKIYDLKRRISGGFQEWDKIQKELDEMIDERTNFISQGNFYPREYVFDINKMKIEKEKARENQLNNPLKSPEEMNSYINEQKSKVENYIQIKSKVEDMLHRMELYEKTIKSKKQSIHYFNKKQELFIYLQDGDFKGARKIMKELKSKIKVVTVSSQEL